MSQLLNHLPHEQRGWISKRRGLTLYTLFTLASSFFFSLPLVQQEDEGIRPSCVQVGPFEEHSQAAMLNRIDQIRDALQLTKSQSRMLAVAAKGVLKQQYNKEEETFYFGNPMKSELWLRTLSRTLNEEQIQALKAFDEKVAQRRQAAKARYNSNEADTQAHADFVGTNLQRHLYLSDEQFGKVQAMLKSHLDTIDREQWDPSLETFYEGNQEALEQLLTDSQRLFFDGQTLKNGIGDGAVWSFEWRKSKCTDCHVSV